MLKPFYKPFISSEQAISPIGLGTVKLGRDKGVKYPSSFVIPDDKQALDIIHFARELGINVIDTAPAYGNSEERLGSLLKGQRQDWFIVSKAGEEFINGESSFDFSPEHLRFSVERSLKRLHSDYIDAVLIHSDGNDEELIEKGVLSTLNDLKKEGKIRFSGMSSKTVSGGLQTLEQADCAMITLNLEQQEEAAVAAHAAKLGKASLVKKAFASGHQADPVEALRSVFSHPGVNCAVIGSINPQHIQANVVAAIAAIKASSATN